MSAADFGTFALMMSVSFLAIGVARAAVAEPFAVRHGARAAADAGDAMGTAVALATGVSTLLVVASVVCGPDLRGPLVVLAVAMVPLLVQDTGRCILLSTRRARGALVNDGVWVGVQAGGVGLLVIADVISVSTVLLVWGIGAAVAAMVACVQLRTRPHPGRTRSWLRTHRAIWPAFVGEHLATMGSWNLAVFVLAGAAGLDAAGSIRGAQTILGPLNLLYLVVPMVFISDMARRCAAGASGIRTVLRWAGALSGGLCAAGLVGTCVLAAIPDDIGRAFLGASWPGVRAVIVPMGIYVSLTGVNLGALVALRSLAAVRHSSRTRAKVAVLLLVVTAVGGGLGGALGFAVGAVVATGSGAVLWWAALRSAALEAMSRRPA